MEEEWKIYKTTSKTVWEVSNYGNVKMNGALYDTSHNNALKNGYPYFGLYTVHRAVAELFIPNPENKPCVDHIDTNKCNNHVNNLRWATYQENANNPLTIIEKRKQIPWHKGKHLSETHRKHIGEANKGKKRSEDVKRQISERNKILMQNPSYKEKVISHLRQDYWKGKKLSEEHKKHLSEAHKGKHKVWDNKELNIYHFE